MVERIKLLWDFHGPDAEKTALHHEIHLKQYAEMNKLNRPATGVETVSEMHFTAFLVVEKTVMITVRDALKPHRGKLYQQQG